ncbi:bifunctional 4-hydroxy-3-methylbut-2-enyl diphosphate reductase/30S ribosomal protein S1 [Pelosinus sp. sgz500959]|uniref:bifunctional 4-hydroxy-3-methylbut-2-enyl diphosphate reductase/30S ribosomal protein S1 n=1 Tax=Pelosinus sp. sgz500959 TaxID=3242472 RepID=UPI00366E619C
MKIIAAEHRGFCYGVKRAVAMAEECIGKPGEIHTLGPIIHNPQMVKHLSDKGIDVANELSEISDGSTVIIRSHGVGPEVYKEAEVKKLNVMDATCPHVKKAQQAAQQLLKEGYTVVVVGEKHHPEVKSIIEWSDKTALVVETVDEAKELAFINRCGIVAQTTFVSEVFQEILDVLKNKCNELKVSRTICTATDLRQQAALELASTVDLMIVVGGKNSANTTRLMQLCSDAGRRVYHIETAQELALEDFQGIETVGITAGASTPDWIIEEVYKKMEEFNGLIDNGVKKLEQDSIIKGTVVGIRQKEVFIDIGYKAEGIITVDELAYPIPENATDIVSNGDIIDVYIVDAESQDGVIKLSKVKADQILAWDKLELALSQKKAVEGKVLEAVKGGLRVAVFGIQGFIPASMVELQFTEDLSPFVNQTLQLVPIEVDRITKRVVLSRKILLEAERHRQEDELFSTLAVGQVFTGKVRRIVDFGAFVDIGGIDGLVHISDLSWHRVKTPHEVVSIGDEVKVIVLKIDPNGKRISLSLKQVGRDPWLDVIEQFSINMITTAKISKITTFGAFAELVPGVEGLIHVSEMSEQKIQKVEDVVSVGQQVTVKIMDINKENKRIALSISKAQQEVERAEFSGYLSTQESTGLTLGDKFAHLFKRQD